MGKQWKQWQNLFWGLQNHEIKRRLLLGREAMTNIDSILERRIITLPKSLSSQSYGFSNSHVRMWELNYTESWVPNNWCFFEMWCSRRLLRVPWTARRSNQSILRKISPEYSSKNWCWSWNCNNLATWCGELTRWKRPWCWKRLKVGEGDERGWDNCMASLTQWTWV